MRRSFWSFVVCLGLLWPLSLRADEGAALLFPSYSGDTGLAGGIKYFLNDVVTSGDRVESLLFMTLNSQLVAEALRHQSPEWGAFYRSEIKTKNYAYYFYGSGNQNSFNNRGKYQLLQLVFSHEWGERRTSGLRRSLLLDMNWTPFIGRDSSALFGSSLAGLNGSLGYGLGVQLAMDQRDRSENPLMGEYVGGSGKLVLGSSDFAQFGVDYRRYLILQPGTQAGFRGFMEVQVGSVPFHQLLALGGEKRLRGYTEGRFRDVALLGFGIELRHDLPFVKQEWGFPYDVQGAYFVDAGRVAGDLGKLTFAGYHASQGLGLRILLRSDAVVRIDWGFGEDEQAIYFTFGQAV
jgi:outer membrane protein assembly factor BamA